MRFVFALLALMALGVSARAEEPVLNIYNWTDYIDPKVLERFTQETGIKVRYDTYDSLETLEAKLLAGHSGYDLVMPTSGPTLARLVKVGALRVLNPVQIPNWKNLDPAMMKLITTSDPGNQHGAIWLWGSTGIGLIPAKVKALAPDAPMDSWDILLKPEWAKKLAPCGIVMMDSAIDAIPSVLKYLGKDPNSTKPEDLAAVEKTLMAIRPYIRTFASSGALEALAAGEICMAMDYSGDVAQAAARAKEAKRGVVVTYVAPKEGSELGFDMLTIPADAPHPENALKFINFALQPDVMAAITNFVSYPNGVPASKAMIRKDILDNPAVYPPASVASAFFTTTAVPQAAERERTRMWARFKAGQ